MDAFRPFDAFSAFGASGNDIVAGLPGLAHRYLFPTTSAWPDEVGSADGSHTGSPSLATEGAATGVEYNGSSQYTTIGDASTLAFAHQTWEFSVSAWFKWAGPASGTALEAILGNALGSATKGISLFVDDGGSTGGPRGLAAQLCRGQAGVITRLDSDPNAVTVDQLHHALLTCDGVTARLYLDGVQVASDSVIATATGNASHAARIGDTEPGTPSFAWAGEIYDVAIGTEGWGSYAEQIYLAGPGGFG